MTKLIASLAAGGALALAPATGTALVPAAASARPLLSGLHTISTVASTVPSGGDVNPYGIAIVPHSVGRLHAGRLLISNFNDKANGQGTGTTLVEIASSGRRTPFARIDPRHLPGGCPGGVGLTTALGILPGGYVVVGSLPTTNGQSATARRGCLIVLDSMGRPISTIAGPDIQGPWDMTTITHGSTSTLFVSMALVGGAARGRHVVDNSTVVRIRLRSSAAHPPRVVSQTVVADGIPRRDDPAALVIAPTGVALSGSGTLFIADTLQNRISAVPDAMTRTRPAADGGTTVSTGGHLAQPLGLTLAPDGDILTTNGGDGNVVETSPSGHQLAVRTLDTHTGAGSLFGLVVANTGRRLYFVDDGDNTLKVLR